MISLRQIRKGLRWAVESPNLLLRELNRLYYTRGYRRSFNHSGIDVIDADWDTLIVLDACRYDLFEDRSTLPGTLREVESRAAHTSEFITGNFNDRDLTDTVYVTASPIMERGYPERYNPNFHAVVNVWQEDGWNEEHNSVHPSTMVEHALEAAEKYPQKRLIVHFMQPHYPFIGADTKLDKETVPDPAEIETDIWNEMMRKSADISPADVTAAYRGNLDLVLPYVEQLFEEFSGKTVVTADHGNMLGERSWPFPVSEWGHPPGVYTPELVQVPWLEYESGPRRTIVAEDPDKAAERVEDDVVQNRLRQLGYAE